MSGNIGPRWNRLNTVFRSVRTFRYIYDAGRRRRAEKHWRNLRTLLKSVERLKYGGRRHKAEHNWRSLTALLKSVRKFKKVIRRHREGQGILVNHEQPVVEETLLVLPDRVPLNRRRGGIMVLQPRHVMAPLQHSMSPSDIEWSLPFY